MFAVCAVLQEYKQVKEVDAGEVGSVLTQKNQVRISLTQISCLVGVLVFALKDHKSFALHCRVDYTNTQTHKHTHHCCNNCDNTGRKQNTSS